MNKIDELKKEIQGNFYEQKIGHETINKSLVIPVKNIKDAPMSHELCQFSPIKLNDSFLRIGQDIAQHQHRQNTFMYLKHVESIIILSQTAPIEVYETMKDPNTNRSINMFELSYVTLKTVNSAICEILCDIFTKCFNFMYFPETLKTSKMMTFHK